MSTYSIKNHSLNEDEETKFIKSLISTFKSQFTEKINSNYQIKISKLKSSKTGYKQTLTVRKGLFIGVAVTVEPFRSNIKTQIYYKPLVNNYLMASSVTCGFLSGCFFSKESGEGVFGGVLSGILFGYFLQLGNSLFPNNENQNLKKIMSEIIFTTLNSRADHEPSTEFHSLVSKNSFYQNSST